MYKLYFNCDLDSSKDHLLYCDQDEPNKIIDKITIARFNIRNFIVSCVRKLVLEEIYFVENIVFSHKSKYLTIKFLSQDKTIEITFGTLEKIQNNIYSIENFINIINTILEEIKEYAIQKYNELNNIYKTSNVISRNYNIYITQIIHKAIFDLFDLFYE